MYRLQRTQLQLQEGLTLNTVCIWTNSNVKKQQNCREELSLKRNKRIKGSCRSRRNPYRSNWQKSKCLSSLFYGLEACPLNKSQISSLEYAIHCVLRKIFVTKSSTVVNDCLLFLIVLLLTLFTEEKQNFCLNSSTRTIHC